MSSIPVIGTIDATGDEPIVHLPEWMTRNAPSMFCVGAYSYVYTAKGELYKHVGEGENKRAVLLTGQEREAILATPLGQLALMHNQA